MFTTVWSPDPTARLVAKRLGRSSKSPPTFNPQLIGNAITMDMNMGSSNDSGMPMEVMMTPWLHFVGGDNLFFKALHPSSHGAIAGACIVLVLLAILDRYIAAVRGVAEGKWAQRLVTLHRLPSVACLTVLEALAP